MQNEKIAQNLEPSVISKILDALIRKIWLIIVIVIISVSIGAVYGKVRDREYVVYHDVNYVAKNTAVFQTLRSGEEVDKTNKYVVDGKEYYISNKNYPYVKVGDTYYQVDPLNGEYKVKENDATHINSATRYVESVSNFFQSGVVSDRASFYFNQFEKSYNELKQSDSTLEKNVYLQKYIDTINQTKFSNEALLQKVGEKFEVGIYNGIGKIDSLFLTFDKIENNKLFFKDEQGDTHSFSRYSKPSVEGTVIFVRYPNTFENYVAGMTDQDLLKNVGKKFNVTIHKKTSETSWSSNVYQNWKFVEKDGDKLTFFDGEKNVSFSRYSNQKYDESIMNSYIYYIDKATANEEYEYDYNRKSVVASKISSSFDKKQDTITYDFLVGYQDKTTSLAEEKTMLVVLSAKKELQELSEGFNYSTVRATGIEHKYFNIVSISLGDLGHISTNVDISTMKLLVIFVAIGLGISFIIIYLLSLLDTTIKTKKEIESVTGAKLLANILKSDGED